ncbi:hypothetical protein SDC9_129111 [bioreactor metagenome]|uniref:Uncharacterized protein n=1 Tax=bioreactor metagenome TaxID=1076179 RepID=A0A645CYV8_9ZZZZ
MIPQPQQEAYLPASLFAHECLTFEMPRTIGWQPRVHAHYVVSSAQLPRFRFIFPLMRHNPNMMAAQFTLQQASIKRIGANMHC